MATAKGSQLADFADPTRPACATDSKPSLGPRITPLRSWGVITTFADGRVDDDPVTRQTLIDDPCGSGARHSGSYSHDRNPLLPVSDST